MKKYLKIIWQLAKISLMNQMAYQSSFFLAVLGKILRMLILLLFFQAIYSHIENLAGWNQQEILLLVVTYLSIESLVIVTFHRNLFYYLPQMIKNGTFDFVLVKPISPLFYSSFQIIDLMDLTSSLVIVILWVWLFNSFDFNLNFLNVFSYFLLLVNALLFIFSLVIIFSSTVFWTITSTGLGRFFENILKIARFPTDIFKGPLAIFFSYFFPIFFIVTLPVKSLIGKVNLNQVIFAFLFSISLLFIALKFWRYALKHYSSASS